MEGNIPPYLVCDPGPAIIGPDPMPFAIGPPVVASMPGNPNIAVGVIVDPASIWGKTIVKVGNILILTVPLRPAGILLITRVYGASRAGWIADSRRRPVCGAARRDHHNQGNNPQDSFHVCSPFMGISASIVPIDVLLWLLVLTAACS
jgi:hypothetical protein